MLPLARFRSEVARERNRHAAVSRGGLKTDGISASVALNLEQDAEVIAEIAIDSFAADRGETAVVFEGKGARKIQDSFIRNGKIAFGNPPHDPVVDDFPLDCVRIIGREFGKTLAAPGARPALVGQRR